MQSHVSIIPLNSNLCYEILIRVIIFSVQVWLDKQPAFVREIQPNELWKYQYPVTPSYVSPSNLWLIITILPTVILCIDYVINRNHHDTYRGVLTLTLSYGLTSAITTLIKIMVGRPRPDFFYRCFPDGHGTDFDKCTGDPRLVNDGRKSFPSGHSSLSFSCSMFLVLFLIKKFRFLSNNTIDKSWKLTIIILPIILSASIAISRTCDYHHHYEDIIAGSLLGSTLSYIIFKMYYMPEMQCNCKNTDK